MPARVTLSRAKGWKMPPNTVKVARPSKWGNPYRVVSEEGFPLIVDQDHNYVDAQCGDWDEAQRAVVQLFRERCIDGMKLSELRGKNLACWCKPGDTCHADILLELANKPTV